MAKEIVQSPEIQLLPKERFYEVSPSQLLTRLLDITYYMLIFTLGIVVLVFLSRFWLDARIIDMKQVITSKAQMVQGAQEFEALFLKTQELLEEVNNLHQNLAVPTKYLAVVKETIPQDPQAATLTGLTVTSEGVSIRGKGLSYPAVTAFVQALRKREEFVEVRLESLERGEKEGEEKEEESEPTAQEIRFEIFASWEQGKKAPSGFLGGEPLSAPPSPEGP